MAIEFIKQCHKEVLDWPEKIREDLADTVTRLERGHALTMPLSRPMPSICKGVHELRFKDRTGIYRVIYFIVEDAHIWFIHAFKKKTQATSQHDIEVAKERLKRVIK